MGKSGREELIAARFSRMSLTTREELRKTQVFDPILQVNLFNECKPAQAGLVMGQA